MGSLQPDFCAKSVTAIYPDAKSANTYDGVVDCKGAKWARVAFRIGVISSGGTVTASVRDSENSDGSSSAAITGATLTGITPAGDVVTKTVVVYLQPRQRYLVPRMVVAGAAADISCDVELYGHQAEPPATADATITS